MAAEKRKKKLFSTAKSTKLLRSLGFPYCIVTHWNGYAHKSVDAWGFQDIQFLNVMGTGVGAINACGEDVSKHIEEYLSEDWKKENIKKWLITGNTFFIWAWRKRVHRLKDGSKGADKWWHLREIEFFMNGNELSFREKPSAISE